MLSIPAMYHPAEEIATAHVLPVTMSRCAGTAIGSKGQDIDGAGWPLKIPGGSLIGKVEDGEGIDWCGRTLRRVVTPDHPLIVVCVNLFDDAPCGVIQII